MKDKRKKREEFKSWAREKEELADLVQRVANDYRGREKEGAKLVLLSVLRSGEAAMAALEETEDKEND